MLRSLTLLTPRKDVGSVDIQSVGIAIVEEFSGVRDADILLKQM